MRVLELFGAEYFICWEQLAQGSSFFLPTTATPAQVKRALRKAERFFNFQLATRARCEFGRYGVRVWRTY